MTNTCTSFGGLFFLAWLASCAPAAGERIQNLGERLTGTWNATLVASPRGDSIRGTVAFVAGSAGDAFGAYELNLSQLGLPTVTPPDIRAASASGDTIEMVANPGTPNALRLRGELRADTISGVWSAEMGRSSERGGRFTLSRKR